MSSTPSPAPTSSAPSSSSSSTPAPPPGSNLASQAHTSTAELKRLQRAQKKAEQQARKDERKRQLEETGIDPGLLPAALAGDLGVRAGEGKTKGFREREWVEVPRGEGEEEEGKEGRKVKLLSWNMLAQALVRRELFPGSDCLRGKDRLPALMQEVTYYDPDIACLQEVDRLSDHLPLLTLTHDYTSFIGYPNKKHGLLIATKRSVFSKVGEKGIRLDDLPVMDTEDWSEAPSRVGTPQTAATPPPAGVDRAPSVPPQEKNKGEKDAPAAPESNGKDEDFRLPDASSPSSRASRRSAGISRITRNVGLFVALEFKDQPGKGVIVGTTHLFWSGDFVYERTRQTAILLREARRFRESKEEWHEWPVFLAGDFNTQPNELTYRLAISPSSSLPPPFLADFERSRVVHHSVDKFWDPSFEPPTPAQAEPKEGEDQLDDPTEPKEKPIKNSRPGNEQEDGIVSLDTLRGLFARATGVGEGEEGEGKGVRSAYGEAYGKCPGEERRWYVDRKPEVQAGNGWRAQESEEEKEKRREGMWEERVKRGDFEPVYSNFTPLWRCTLDYIFLLPPSPSSSTSANSPSLPAPQWRSLLQMHDFHETCEPGLPRKGIEPSDHVAIGAVVELY
ncbi:hypothetical protein JCM8547_004988 [Rhodosporidiobolus lusitaniae]